MTLDSIERLLVEKLQRLLGKEANILAGPLYSLPLGGMQETLFIHAARFEDHNGLTADGATIARRPFKNGRAVGFAEERPCHIVLEITCIATTYNRINSLSERVSPEILLILACEREFDLGVSGNRQSSLKFTDFQASLNQMETIRQEDNDLILHMTRLVFHLNGALHVKMSKFGGLKVKRPLVKKAGSEVKKAPVKKPRSVKLQRTLRKTRDTDKIIK